MKQTVVLLVHREASHNPGSGRDDRRFLRRAGRALRKLGAKTDFCEADAIFSASSSAPDLILSMGRSREVGKALEAAYPGVPCVNRVSSTALTLRYTLYPLLAESGFAFPETEEIDIDAIRESVYPYWLKRRDYHHLKRGDVAFVCSKGAEEKALAFFRRQRQRNVFRQEHVCGSKHKFYAIRDNRSGGFRYFVFRSEPPAGTEWQLRKKLPGLLERIGLEIFGGDILVDPDGMVYLVDLNSWPSFKGLQREAAKVIAGYCRELLEQINERTGQGSEAV